MIDQGITPADKQALYFRAFIMFIIVLLGIVGRITLAYASGRLTTTMIRDIAMICMINCKSNSITNIRKLVSLPWSQRVTSDAFLCMQFVEMSLRMELLLL